MTTVVDLETEIRSLDVRVAVELGLLQERLRAEFYCVPKSAIARCVNAAQRRVRTAPGESAYMTRVEEQARPEVAALHSAKIRGVVIPISIN
ncbi:MAG TPA: hypothetical protein VHV79_07655 [Mycobacteriales bacterium]|nr:hypothetical protein [Mycobacteriales bacterium]